MDISRCKRIVVKIGTSTLTHETGMMNIRRVEMLVKVLSDLKNAGKEIILVSSGAIGIGVGKLGLKSRPTDTPSKQAAAAVGQCELMYLYDKLFEEYHHPVAQLLLTRDVIENSIRKQNVINTLKRLLDMDVIPVINENDTVSVDEIVFGDNDTLSAIVAVLSDADLLVLMSDIDGLFDSDPHKNPDAKLIPIIDEIDERIHNLAGSAGTSRGTGGMVTKINAAEIATAEGIPMAILNGQKPELLYDLFDNLPVGSIFLPKKESL